MTTRRQLLKTGLAAALATVAGSLRAATPRIGILSARPLNESLFASGILRRLRELGYGDGSGAIVEFRAAAGVASRYPALARELVERKCDVIFTIVGAEGVRAIRALSSTVPIVILAADFDPVDAKLVSSLRRPGNNMTGLHLQSVLLAAKRLEILADIVPGARRVLVLSDAHSRQTLAQLNGIADSRGISLTVAHFEKQPYDFEDAFAKSRAAKAQGMVMPASPVLSANRKRIAQLALENRLPSVGTIGTAEAGFLASYSTDNVKASARVAELGALVIRGGNAGEIPMELASEFELVLNASTAKALGIPIPESVRARATRIVQ